MNNCIMKKVLLFLIALFLFFPVVVNASTKEIDIHLFYSKTCSHCKAEKEYLSVLQKEKSNVKVHLYEVTSNKENSLLLEKVQELINGESPYVPYTVIGNKYEVGFANHTKAKIESIISSYEEGEYVNIVSGIKDGTITSENIDEYLAKTDVEVEEVHDKKISFLWWDISLKGLSLPIIAMVIGLIDGFNPCAMWILLFLISMLIGMKDRKKMMYLGSLFIVASASVYLLFMLAWLNIVMTVTEIRWIQILIAVVALIGGLINIRSYIKSLGQDSGCTVVDDKKRKKIFGKIKKFTSEKSLLLASIGVVALAVSVNIVELACSAGLPVLFADILAINEVSSNLSTIYILIYVFFFMLDDLIVFNIAMFTLKVTGVTTKYTKYTHLIGGIIMLLIGILLILKPEWIMFNF